MTDTDALEGMACSLCSQLRVWATRIWTQCCVGLSPPLHRTGITLKWYWSLLGLPRRFGGRIWFEGVPAQTDRLDGAVCRPTGVGPEDVARSKELVLLPASVRLSRLEEWEEKWCLPSLFLPKKSPEDLCLSDACSKIVNKFPSHIPQVFFKLLFLS